MKAAVLCVLTLAGLATPSVEFAGTAESPPVAAGPAGVLSGSRPGPAICTAPAGPGGTTRTVPQGNAKPSSFAPHPHSRKRAYGAPIPPPIVSKHARRPRHAGHSPPK